MQFKFISDSDCFNANHFIYEIYRSRMKIEILQALNRRAITMSHEGKLTSFSGENWIHYRLPAFGNQNDKGTVIADHDGLGSSE